MWTEVTIHMWTEVTIDMWTEVTIDKDMPPMTITKIEEGKQRSFEEIIRGRYLYLDAEFVKK